MDREEELCFTYKTDEEPCGYVDTRRKRPLTSDETIALVIGRYLENLQEIFDAEKSGEELSPYAEGAKSVYVETLQLFQEWEKMEEYGLNFEIEEIYTVK